MPEEELEILGEEDQDDMLDGEEDQDDMQDKVLHGILLEIIQWYLVVVEDGGEFDILSQYILCVQEGVGQVVETEEHGGNFIIDTIEVALEDIEECIKLFIVQANME